MTKLPSLSLFAKGDAFSNVDRVQGKQRIKSR